MEPLELFRLVWAVASVTVLGTILVHILRSTVSGAPFIPSYSIRGLVKLAAIRPGDVVYELGCGDGRFCIAAVKAGASRAVGYEISSLVLRLAHLRSWLAGTTAQCTFQRRDIRTCDPSEASLVFLYLMPAITDELAAGPLLRLKPGARVLSSCFHIDTTLRPQFRLLVQEKVGIGAVAYLYERL